MALNRENEFPATSIGRSAGIRVMQQASVAHEAHAHPLLSPGPNSPTASEQGHAAPTSGGGTTPSANGGPRYVPYTPRQRVTPTAATTGTTVHPPSPQQHQGDATSKLQLMHLKAAAQGIGLDSGTLGWSILEKLVSDVEASEEWVEVWTAITSGKATLLLPLESSFANEKITADFVKDHVVLCDGPSRNHAPIITLSGLRGTLQGETLTFRSTINPSSKLFHDLLNPSTRTTALALLPDLPIPLPDISPVAYPQLNVPSYSPSLPLPPRTQGSTKPPLPPRPTNRPNAPAHAPTSRISIPFASLFGGGQSKASAPVPASPPASIRSLDSAHDSNAPVDLSAFTVDRRVVRREIAKEMNNAIKGELKASLASTSSLGNIPVPSWVAERVHDMTSDWYPFIKKPPAKLKKLNNEKNGKDINSGYIVNTIEESPEDAAERLQDFYLSLDQDMRVGGTPFISRRKDRDAESDAENDKDREKREQNKMESETRVRDVMEAVERTITSLFYDRLFMQTTTDDASHDEALSSRIAALNMLDLGLGHLGIEVGESVNEPELDSVVKACGDMLTGLDSCRSPGDKSSILVAAHKIIVDGLSKLPPIRLISENDAKDDQEDDLRTAKPTFTNEGELNPQPQPSKPLGVHASEAIPEAYNASPPPSIHSSSTEPPVTDNASIGKTSSSKVKSPPPPLSLEDSRPPMSDASSSPSARLEVSCSQKEPTPVSGDLLLPMIIFSVVKANPPHLVSNLLFTQRFRNQSIGGEESYCLINLLAVAEFLENVDMAGLGLGDSDKVMSTADLTPIPLTRSPVTAETPLEPADAQGLRGRVGQQVDAITDSANKVITGVVDSSFGILRSFMPSNQNSLGLVSAPGTPASASTRPGFGLLRRESGFSIASLAASLPITGRSRSNTATEESGQQLVPVSRPSSVRSRISRTSLKIRLAGDESQDDDDSDDGDESAATGDEESEADEEEGEDEAEEYAATSDARSIRSFESMLSASKEKSRGARARKSLSDRLASVSALASLKGSEPSSRRTSLLHPSAPRHGESASSSRAGSPVQSLHLAPPKQRFIECTADDLRLSEVGELLRDYRRLVEGIRTVGGFDE